MSCCEKGTSSFFLSCNPNNSTHNINVEEERCDQFRCCSFFSVEKDIKESDWHLINKKKKAKQNLKKESTREKENRLVTQYHNIQPHISNERSQKECYVVLWRSWISDKQLINGHEDTCCHSSALHTKHQLFYIDLNNHLISSFQFVSRDRI